MAISTKSAALVTLRDVQAIAPILFTGRNTKGRPAPFHMKSAPGAGKTEISRRIAQQEARRHPGVPFGYGAHNIQISTPADIGGFTMFETQRLADPMDPESREIERKVSVNTVPVLFAFSIAYIADSEGNLESVRTDDFGRPLYVGSIVRGRPLLHGLIVLDEFMQGDPENRKAVAPMLDEGRIATHFLPPGVAVWAASNRASDKSGTTKALAFLTNREIGVEIAPDHEGMLAYFEGRAGAEEHEPILPLVAPGVYGFPNGRMGSHPAITAYLKQNLDMVGVVPTDPGEPFLTSRSMSLVSSLFDAMLIVDDSDVPVSFQQDSRRRRLFTALASGAIGDNNAAQLNATIDLFDEIPTIPEIVANPKGAKVSDKKDAQLIAAYMCSNAMDLPRGEAICQYLKRLGDAFYKNAMVNAATRNGALLALPSVNALFANDPAAITRMMTARAKAERAARGR